MSRKRYHSGMLRDSVRLLKPETDRDDMGGVSFRYIDTPPVRAAVLPLSSRERLIADKNAGEIAYRVVTRYSQNLPVRSGWRLDHNGAILEVDGPPIDVENRHQWVELLCKEVQ